MKRIILFLLFSLFSLPSPAQMPDASEHLSAAELRADFDVLREAMDAIHPGLYRFSSREEVDARFEAFKASLNKDMTYGEAYLAFSHFIPQLLCGHTLVNPFNQEDRYKSTLFAASDKLPFTFDWIDGRMIVTMSTTESNLIETGTEILSINGTPASKLLYQLIRYVSADGSNDAKRVYEMQLTGLGQHELFDIYFPLLFPPENGAYLVEGRAKNEESTFTSRVNTISRSERYAQLTEKYGPLPENYDDLWSFELLNNETAYLRIGSFVTYKMSIDWQAFLTNAYTEIKEKKIPNLIIDIRGNSGGMTEVVLALLGPVNTKTVTLPMLEERIAYEKVPESVRPYVDTWDDSIFDLTEKIKPSGKGYFIANNASSDPQTYPPTPDAYTGTVYVLTDAANSSATFLMASIVKQNELGTLVGEVTGGNLMGTNGGMMFFLRLPNSKIEVDIPVYGYYPNTKQPDRGVIPDILVERTIADAIEGKDTILLKTLELIENN